MHSAIDRASTVLAVLAALVALGAFAPADAVYADDEGGGDGADDS